MSIGMVEKVLGALKKLWRYDLKNYKNPLNMKIFQKVEEIIGWPIEPLSLINQLPITEKITKELEEEFSVQIRNNCYEVKINLEKVVSIQDLVHQIDFQYTKNYFQSESGTFNQLIDVTDHSGEKIQTIKHKWKIRGQNLVNKLKSIQKNKPDLKILDLGCGYNLYKDHLENVTGVDPYVEQADILCRIVDFKPTEKYDVIICFGPMNWYTYDEQYRNFLKIKECLKEDGVCYWSHVHNYYKLYQPRSDQAFTWIAGDLEDAYKNNAFYFFDKIWKYNQYFNWTEISLTTLCEHVGLSTGEMQYDDCGCYRPPMWRLFCELRHNK